MVSRNGSQCISWSRTHVFLRLDTVHIKQNCKQPEQQVVVSNNPHKVHFLLYDVKVTVWCTVAVYKTQGPQVLSVATKINPWLWPPTSPYLNLCKCHLWDTEDTGLMQNHILCIKLKITILTQNANISRHELYHALRNICRYRACSKVAGWRFEFSPRNKGSWTAGKKKWTLEFLDMCILPALTATVRDIICDTQCSTY